MRAKINILCPSNKTTKVVLVGISILDGNIWRSSGISGVKRTSRQSFAFFPIRPGRRRPTKFTEEVAKTTTLSNMSQASNNKNSNSSWISKVSPTRVELTLYAAHDGGGTECAMRNSHEGEILSLVFPRLQVLMLVDVPPVSVQSRIRCRLVTRGINRSYSFTFSFHGLESDFCRVI